MSSPFPASISAAVTVNGEWWDGWWGEVETEQAKVWRVLGWGNVAEKREARRAGNRRWHCPRSVAHSGPNSGPACGGACPSRGPTKRASDATTICACLPFALPCTEMHHRPAGRRSTHSIPRSQSHTASHFQQALLIIEVFSRSRSSPVSISQRWPLRCTSLTCSQDSTARTPSSRLKAHHEKTSLERSRTVAAQDRPLTQACRSALGK